jgi:O-antigen ligase
MAVLLTGSRAATILMMASTLIAFVGFIVRCTLYRSETRSPWVITLLCAVFALFVGLGAYFLNTNRAFDRLGKLLEEGSNDFSVSTRLVVRKATMEMAQDNLATGWGAGSFRHYFPVYQRHYPEIYQFPQPPNSKHKPRTMRWEYAHNDYVQLLAELGVIGATIIFALLACGIRHLLRERAFSRPHLLFIVLALGITAAHAWVDFQFHNPAILFLWCASAALLGRWAELESRRASTG